jgi:PAS domain S-box-containing protein
MSSADSETESDRPIRVNPIRPLPADTREQYRLKLARIALDEMYQFVAVLDAQGTLLEVNRAALEGGGLKLSDVEGKPFWECFWWGVSEETRENLKNAISRAAQGEFIRYDVEVYGRAAGTETIIIDFSMIPVRDESGQVTFIVPEGRDITEKKAQEREIARKNVELAALDRAKTAFFSNVSHEFRTPLTLMLGPLEEGLASEQGSPNREETALIHRNGLRLLKLVNTLLDFSRIEAGRVQASYEPTDLSAVTTDLASAFRSAIENAGMSLTVEAPRLSEAIFIDRDMWEKIVLNLLSNAFKFTFEGAIAVLLDEGPTSVNLRVSDTGIGVPEVEIPHLFERFHRVEGAKGRTYEGTGIGLALVHELVKLHGGTVAVESAVGKGTAFTVRIPKGTAHLPADRVRAERTFASTALRADAYLEEALRWPSDAARVGTSEQNPGLPFREGLGRESHSQEPMEEKSRARILLADDNADMRDYVRRLLSQRYAVDAVADGEAALASAITSLPDLVLADVMMPRLDGFALLRALRKDPRTQAVPVILLSARAGEEARIDGLDAGADDYLTKPFSARELFARVTSHLELARVRQEASEAVLVRTAQFETLLNNAPLGVYLVGGDFRIREVNPVALPVFGGIPDLIGRDFDEVIHVLWPKASADQVVERFRHTLRTGEPFADPEYVADRRDRGARECYEWQIGRIRLSDGYGVVCYFRDISSQVLAREALQETDRRKDEFLAMLAHELRNPLAPLAMAAHLLGQRAEGQSELLRMVDVIARQTAHLTKLVDDLLEGSRVAQGKIRLEKKPVDVSQIAGAAIELARPLVDAKKHELTLTQQAGPLWVEADRTRLVQVLGNLLSNAAKYTSEGGRIQLTIKREGQEIVCRVRDNGIGIAEQLKPRLFELFSQGETSLARSEGGLGIGLSLVRALVDLHGGTVEAHSDGPSLGSEFVVRLPEYLGRVNPAELTGVPEERLEIAPRRILVVDDNRDAADSLAEALTEAGHKVQVVYDGTSVLDAVRTNRPEVVLLDLGLPGLNGFEVARRLRREHGNGITIIAVSGYAQEQDRRASTEAGFDHHLVKPVRLDSLIALLARPASN